MKEILACIPSHDLSPGSSMPLHLFLSLHSAHSYQELIRNRGLMRDRKQHAGILLLNSDYNCNKSCLGTCFSTVYLAQKHRAPELLPSG